MKRVFICFLVLIISLTAFSSCEGNRQEGYPLTVNSTPVDGEIFRYYLDEVWDSEAAGGTKEGRINEATHMCIRYVAVNSTFSAYSLSLTDAEKAELSNECNVLWNMFGEYYSDIGVGKETFIKIRTSEAYTEKLRLYFFDKGGTEEINDGVLRGVMQENYVSFVYVRTPSENTDVYGHNVPYTEEEAMRLTALYNSSVSSVAASYGIDKAYTSIAAEFPLTEKTYETKVIDRNDHEFAAIFYDTVKSMPENTARVFQYNGYVYLVYRTNIVNDGIIFPALRSECLRIISEEPLQSKINIMCNQYQSVRDSALVNEYYKNVIR